MNGNSIVVFKTDDDEWKGEVNGGSEPRSTAGYSFVMDPDGHIARSAVLRETAAILTAQSRFNHAASMASEQRDLAGFIHNYFEQDVKPVTMASRLLLDHDLTDEGLLDGIYSSVLASDSEGATIGHALLSVPFGLRSQIVASAGIQGSLSLDVNEP